MIGRSIRNVLANSAVVIAAIAIALVLAEFMSRVVLPISPGAHYVTLDGEPLAFQSKNRLRLPSAVAFRQVSSEYDARTTLTALGHRVPEVQGNPDVVFLGDSFTFGTGLADEETFVWIFCRQAGLSCANLGQIGTGTGAQMDVLEHYLDSESWRPREVKLFMVVMSAALMGGNDFVDNLDYAQAAGKVGNAESSAMVPPSRGWHRIVDLRKDLLRSSNLTRIAYYFFAPQVRAVFSPVPNRERLELALARTQAYLQRFDKLSTRYGFTYRIYVLHPAQDLLGGTYHETLNLLRHLAPAARVIGTAELFLDQPQDYYYAYDGHLNPRGSRVIAEFLSRERRIRDDQVGLETSALPLGTSLSAPSSKERKAGQARSG